MFDDYDYCSTVIEILQEIESSNDQAIVFMTLKSKDSLVRQINHEIQYFSDYLGKNFTQE